MRLALLVALAVVAGTYVWARGADERALSAREELFGVTIRAGDLYCSELVAKAWRDAFGPLVEPRPVSLGVWASRAARLTNGELVDGTPMVSPADLVRSGRLVRVVDELHP